MLTAVDFIKCGAIKKLAVSLFITEKRFWYTTLPSSTCRTLGKPNTAICTHYSNAIHNIIILNAYHNTIHHFHQHSALYHHRLHPVGCNPHCHKWIHCCNIGLARCIHYCVYRMSILLGLTMSDRLVWSVWAVTVSVTHPLGLYTSWIVIAQHLVLFTTNS